MLRILSHISVIFMLFSCCDMYDEKDFLSECDFLKDANIICEDEEVPCDFLKIYTYENEIYSLCVCCLCNKAPMAMDCNGAGLCGDNSCMKDFNLNAEYLFSVEEL